MIEKFWSFVFLMLFIVLIWFAVFFVIVGFKYKYKIHPSNELKLNSWVKELFMMPLSFWEDVFNNNPDEFKEMGVHLVCGSQGDGKTIFCTWLLLNYKMSFPKLKIRSNCGLKFEDGVIENANDLVMKNNGIFGEIDFLDEIQNWFCSLESRNFPIEMLQEISQQRKQHKCIYATSQVFERVAKPIREQVNYLYMPKTFFGCFTVCVKGVPELDSESNLKDFHIRKIYMFRHTKEIREAYDTYKKIKHLVKGGLIKRDYEQEAKI